MYKKLFISFLLVAIFNLLVGCYSSMLVTVPEYNQIEEEDKPSAISVVTKYGQEYHFSDSNFYVVDDTLYGNEVITLSGEIPFEGKFAFGEIEFYSFEDKWTYKITISEYEQIENERGKPEEIYIIKYDSTKYYFMKDDYIIDSDTLYGKGKLLLGDREELLNREIAISDIESIQFENFERTKTCLSALGIGVLVFVVWAAIWVASDPFSFESK